MASRGCALVTGGARRIGRALVTAAAEAGYDVAIHVRQVDDDAEAAAGEVRARGRRAAIFACDLRKEAATVPLIGEAEGELGPVTLLVNSASAFEEDAFDIAMSSFGAMFFADAPAAFTNIGRGVRPGGRLAVLAWRELARNEWLIALRESLAMGRQLPVPPPDVPSPFALADPDRVRGILTAAGYEDVDFTPIDEPIEFGSDADDAYAFMRTMGIVAGLTHDLDDADRARALDELQRTVAAHDTGDGVLFGTSAWLITARRPCSSRHGRDCGRARRCTIPRPSPSR